LAGVGLEGGRFILDASARVIQVQFVGE